MGYVIALAGKGGTGKTTIAALIVRLLKEKKAGSILAIDADPNSNLAEALGLAAGETIGSILDTISACPEGIPAGMPKDRYIEYRVQSAVQEADGFDVLTMGRPEGPGCYCYVNNALRNCMDKLIKEYDYIIIDNEAGLEHLSRRTTRFADTLLVVSDASRVGLKAARRIRELCKELDVKTRNNLLVVNRCLGDPGEEAVAGTDLEYVGCVASDDQITAISLNGNSLWDLKDDAVSLASLRSLGETVWRN
jgi:CO dehydrogenase maturation factor